MRQCLCFSSARMGSAAICSAESSMAHVCRSPLRVAHSSCRGDRWAQWRHGGLCRRSGGSDAHAARGIHHRAPGALRGARPPRGDACPSLDNGNRRADGAGLCARQLAADRAWCSRDRGSRADARLCRGRGGSRRPTASDHAAASCTGSGGLRCHAECSAVADAHHRGGHAFFAGLGLPGEAPGWGTLLQEAGNVGALGTAPWLFAPAAALFSLVLGVNLSFERSSLGLAANTPLVPTTVTPNSRFPEAVTAPTTGPRFDTCGCTCLKSRRCAHQSAAYTHRS